MNPKQQNQLNPKDIIPIIKRRKSSFLFPFTFVFSISLILALVLPSYYRSSATILIEEQEIPQDFVMATVSSFAEQRLEMIKQRIMSHGRLLGLINQFELYPELKDKWTTEEIVEKMRKHIQVKTLSAEVMDRRSGRPTAVTIAFTLSYEGKYPKKVHQITSELTSLFLEENLKVRTRQTKEAIKFFEDELKRVKEDLNVLNGTISAFKEKNLLKLPEYTQINMQLLQSTDKTVENLNEQLKLLMEREKYFVTQLSLISPEMEFNSDIKRLEDLKIQLVSLGARFSDEYPDVIKTKSEIEKLNKQLKESGQSKESKNRKPDNPAYINISSQLSGVRSEIESVHRQIVETKTKKKNFETRIESAASIEGEYRTLISDQASMTAKINDLTQKLMEATVAYGLEKDQKGERFTLIDPARYPERPFKPRRIVILIIGFILSMGVSAGMLALTEFMDDRIYSPENLSRTGFVPVIGEIPHILTVKERRHARQRKRLMIFGTVAVPVITVTIVHLFVRDIYVIWAQIMRKLVF